MRSSKVRGQGKSQKVLKNSEGAAATFGSNVAPPNFIYMNSRKKILSLILIYMISLTSHIVPYYHKDMQFESKRFVQVSKHRMIKIRLKD